MNNAAVRYQRVLKKKLPCGGDMRRILLSRFQVMLDSFVEEHPDPTEEEMHTAFGPPEAMVEILSEGISEEEIKRFKNRKLQQKIVASALAAILLLFAGYAFFFKEVPVTFVDEAYIYPTETPNVNS